MAKNKNAKKPKQTSNMDVAMMEVPGSTKGKKKDKQTKGMVMGDLD
ncbi:hypothetical protein SAMN02745196_02894 [Clostridium collagenovorans DSM 3089]|uniref:Uncharacterized protein n=1 Tax=Clostridium collagenovorans DSM 3089 TaxID=1121306 RepID=A0A1M5YFD7_9CLOT|nr:hypothetical protein [Clostridium collagenovorans]SHI10755.1 hypothetical protein SAMN02745196_02894 [Clostridium collagenovorans DSM 3089]